VARRTGRLDLASSAVRPLSATAGAAGGSASRGSTDVISDVSTHGASEQLIDRIPAQQRQRQSAGEEEADRYMEDITQDASGITLYDEASSLDDDKTIYFNLTSIPPAIFKIKGSFN
jgi:hypothetical protein